jgi:hypothetical protein
MEGLLDLEGLSFEYHTFFCSYCLLCVLKSEVFISAAGFGISKAFNIGC